MTYRKIFKWILVVLFIAGVIISAFGFVKGWPGTDEWKGDLEKAAELTEVVGTMEANGVENLSGEALEARKAEVAALRTERNTVITEHNALAKELGTIRKNSKEYKEKEALKAELETRSYDLEAEANELEQAVTLAERKAELDALNKKIASQEQPVDAILIGTYIMMIIVLVALLVAFIVNWINNPWALVKFAAVLFGAGLLVYLAYALAPTPDAATVQSYNIDTLTAGKVEMTDALLYLTYLMFGATIVTLITSWIVGAVRK